MSSIVSNNVATAFALTFAAGFATVLGAMVVYSKRLIQIAKPITLAIALSVSAGVMIFISLVEIFGKSVESLAKGLEKHSTLSENTRNGHAWLIATICFGFGILLIYGIDALVHKIAPENEALDIEHIERLSHEITCENKLKPSPAFLESHTPGSIIDQQSRERLQRLGLISALAIGLHNIPEGIATYVGTIQNPAVGASLAIGIGLHNIPEGIAVATPIYFATGSRARSIMWSAISALAEPFGGFLAWLAIGNGINPIMEGLLFGLVCGIMVAICIKELWPTAYRFAGGKTQYVALGSFAGMFIMVTSLILFGYAGV